MFTKRLMVGILVFLVVLALCGNVQAGSVTSRGSGIGSHDAGGSGYATMSTAAGNSAHVDREVCRTLDHEGSPTDVTVTWGDTATDDVGSVTAAGTLKVSREISGGDDGLVEVCARIWANLDETSIPVGPDDSVYVDTGMESTVEVSAGPGVTAEGSASVTGYATGSGNWAFDGVSGDVSATSSGKVSASGTAKDGAEGCAMSIITAYAETYCDGYTAFMGPAPADNGFYGVYGGLLTMAEGSGQDIAMEADASGSAVMSARGSSDDYSFSSSGSAIGSSSGEFEVDPVDGGGEGAFMSGLGVYFDDIVPDIDIDSVTDSVYPLLGAGGTLETWSGESDGSMEASAKGIAILRESAYNGVENYAYDAFGSVEGSAEVEAEQSGMGASAQKTLMKAAPIEPGDGYVLHNFWYPCRATPCGIMDKCVAIVFDEFADATSYIEAESGMESGMPRSIDGGLDGSSSASIGGTAFTTFGGYTSTNTELDDGWEYYSGSTTTRANGAISQELAVDGDGFAAARSIIDSIASLGPEIENHEEGLGGSGGIDLGRCGSPPSTTVNWVTFSGASDLLYTASYAEGSASSESAVSGSATSGATGYYSSGGVVDGDSSALQTTTSYEFDSTASASGKVESEAEANEAEAESASVIIGFNAVGPYLEAYRDCSMYSTGPFVLSKHGLLSVSAVVDGGGQTGSAEGTASGSSNAGGTLTIEQFELEDDLQAQQLGEKGEMISATKGSGTLTSKMSVKNGGMGRSESMLEGGNIVTSPEPGVGYITSLGIDDWDSSIDTYSCGFGFSDTSQVKGSAAISKGVSTESAHFGYFTYDESDDDWDPEFALDTKTVMTDPSKAEIKVKGDDCGRAVTYAYGGSEAAGDMYGAFLNSWAGFGAEASRCEEKDTVKASTKKLNIYTEARADGLMTYARVNKGFATATLSSSGNTIGPGDLPVMAGYTGPGIIYQTRTQSCQDDPLYQSADAFGEALVGIT